MEMTKETLKGKVNSSVGKVKEMAGKATNNKDLEAKGFVQKNKGKAQKTMEAVKEKIKKGTYALGDGIEQVGKKLQENGYIKTGSALEKAGDKIEHITD